MELKDLYNISDEQMYETLMRVMPPEIKQQVEEMFIHKFGLEQIESMLERGIKEVGIPKEIVDNLTRGLRWKYIQLVTEASNE